MFTSIPLEAETVFHIQFAQHRFWFFLSSPSFKEAHVDLTARTTLQPWVFTLDFLPTVKSGHDIFPGHCRADCSGTWRAAERGLCTPMFVFCFFWVPFFYRGVQQDEMAVPWVTNLGIWPPHPESGACIDSQDLAERLRESTN